MLLYLIIMLVIAVVVTFILVALAAATDGELGHSCQVIGGGLVFLAAVGLLCGMAALVANGPPGSGTVEATELSEAYQGLTGIWIAPVTMAWFAGIFLLGLLVIYLVWQGRRN